jgi:hypothetical protein
MGKKVLIRGAAALVVLLAAAQLVQPDRTNPAMDPAIGFKQVAKPAPELQAILERSCFDCHSNQTVWPWYSKIAPVSWLVARDVKAGRSKLSFSQWNIYSPEATKLKFVDACREVRAGEMPVPAYLLMHPNAKLAPVDIETICAAAK